MKNITRYSLAFVLSAITIETNAQTQTDSTYQNTADFEDSVELFKSYKHMVSKVKKLDNNPHFSDTNFLAKTFEYKMPLVVKDKPSVQSTNIESYFFSPKNNQRTLYKNFVELGYETKHSPFLGLGLQHQINDIRFGVIGQYQQDSENNNQKTYFGYKNGSFKAFGEYDNEDFTFGTSFKLNNQIEYLAAVKTPDYNERIRMNYSNVEFQMKFDDLRTKSWLKDAQFVFGRTSQRKYANNKYINLNVELGNYFVLDKYKWSLEADYHFSENAFEQAISAGNNVSFFSLKPAIRGYHKKMYWKAGLAYASTWDNKRLEKRKDHLLPEVSVEFPFDKYVFHAGLEQNIQLWDFTNLYRQTALLTREKQDVSVTTLPTLYAGVKGIFESLSYKGRLSYTLPSDNQFFFFSNDSIQSFSSEYIKSLRIGADVYLTYPISKKIETEAQINFQHYFMSSDANSRGKVIDVDFNSQKQAFQFEGKLSYLVKDNWKLFGSFTYGSKQNVGIYANNSIVPNTYTETSSVVDLSVGTEYGFNNQLKGFLEARNLFNQRYEIWNNYYHKGFYLRGGFRYKF
jgi:hypothetical protein